MIGRRNRISNCAEDDGADNRESPAKEKKRSSAPLPRNSKFIKNVSKITHVNKGWEDAYDIIPDSVMLIDDNYNIVCANKAATNMFGRPLAEVLGCKCYKLMHMTTKPPDFCPHTMFLKDGKEHFSADCVDWRGEYFAVYASPYLSDDGTAKGAMLVAKNISEFKRIARTLQLSNILLDAIRSAQQLYIEKEGLGQTFWRLLRRLIEFTETEYGAIYEILADGSGNYSKLTLAVSDISLKSISGEYAEDSIVQNPDIDQRDELIGQLVHTGRAIISNDIIQDPRSLGFPAGLPMLESYMAVPLYFAGKLLGTVILANRRGGYSQEVADFLEPFAGTVASIINANRLDKASKAHSEDISLDGKLLKAMINSVTVTAMLVTLEGKIRMIN